MLAYVDLPELLDEVEVRALQELARLTDSQLHSQPRSQLDSQLHSQGCSALVTKSAGPRLFAMSKLVDADLIEFRSGFILD